jgi:Zn-dependent protease
MECSLFDFNLPTLLATLVILLVGFPIHELSHAFVAYRLGDNTAKYQGRLTLNPLKHLDPLGSILLLIAHFGWAKPVPVNPYRLRYGPRVGHALVSAAGPVSNLLMASLMALVYRLGLLDHASQNVLNFAYMFILINATLFLFNLIPLPPLDGFAVLNGLVGERISSVLQPLQAYGQFILMAIFLVPLVMPQLSIGGFLSLGAARVSALLLGL